MKLAAFQPSVHFFVCANRRAQAGAGPNDLGPGCGERGEAVFDALKREIQRRGLLRQAWVAKTSCLGFCPKRGCAIGLSPGPRYILEAEAGDASARINAIEKLP